MIYSISYMIYFLEPIFINRKKNMPVTRIEPIFNERGKFEGYKDVYTGEKYGLPTLTGKGKRSPYLEWYMGNQRLAREIFAKDRDFKGDTHRVLWFLISVLDFENWIQLSITDIAKELEMRQPNVSREIKLLEKKKIIIRGKKIGRSSSFRFNPDYIWKGEVINLEKYRDEKEQERIKELKNKTNKRKQKKLKELSEEYNISIEKLLELQNKLNLS